MRLSFLIAATLQLPWSLAKFHKYVIPPPFRRILANRITELEKALESWCNGQRYIPIFPSQMLLDEFLPENGLKPDDTKDGNNGQIERPDYEESKVTGTKYSGCDDGNNLSESSGDSRSWESPETFGTCGKLGAKTVLPIELEELVREALAEMNSSAG